ncbi:efflux transporter outer membrane subunit [uncultured Arcticibacterium sp.]|uniref:efflux transporter outer membrane subunit n=1 Tax=uncultured Arcticibacterium sp. TaxID=2173042 RepID=UPI0030F9F40A
MKLKLSISILTFGVFLLSACVKPSIYQQPNVNTEDLYRGVENADSTSMATLEWQQLFTDPILQDLIETGLAENLNLKIAVERIAAVQATFRESELAFFPSLSAGLSRTENQLSSQAVNFPVGSIRLATSTNSLQLNTSWEADIWGKLKSAKKAAYANLMKEDATKRVVQTELIANIANAYYSLLALDKQLMVTEQTVQNRKESVESMQALKDASYVTEAEVMQAEANLYSAEVLIPNIMKGIRETENILSFLLAAPSSSIRRSSLDTQRAYADLQTGLPAQLLQNRPDVQQAEFTLVAAFENVNVAKTYFYPSLTITASGGFNSFDLKDFFNNSIFYNLVGGLTQPIFSKGRNEARLAIAEADQKQAMYAFQQSLLGAGQEVSNALFAFQTAVEREEIRSKEIESLTKAAAYTKDLLLYSSNTNYTDVLNSEQALIASQLNGVNDKLEQLQSVVNLYKALGGGWE